MPAFDALDPGPHGDYPNVPRTPEGGLDTVRMPIGVRPGRDGRLIDVTPTVTQPDGRIVPITELVPVEPPAETPTTEGTP